MKKVNTDNGGEYMGQEFQDICGELGIIHETTTPYMPEHNGIAERYNRTLQEGSLTLLHDSGLTSRFKVSAIHMTNFIKNQLLHRQINMSPYEAFWASNLKLTGSGPMGQSVGHWYQRPFEGKVTSEPRKVYLWGILITPKHTKSESRIHTLF